ncbi:MAG: aldehyde dehydrogenase family protein [Acidimicrobiia bacterium]|nr:MAG: aldehyde dehydrogenase family protein [Acidimicrobiia bacterium]
MDTTHIDASLATLSSSKTTWARLDIHDKISMLGDLRTRAGRHSTTWVEAAVKAKGLSMDSPLAGEEWLAGPYGLIDALNALETTLTQVATGTDVLSGYKVFTRTGGQVVVEVSPTSFSDRILFSGSRAQVWMQPQVTIESLADTIGEFYRQPLPDGSVCLILGAGNVASIPPLDVVNKLFNEGQVTLLKMNPVNEYLGEIFEEIFADFIEAGYVRFVYGGGDVGEYLTSHDDVDAIHITGSAHTYNTIRYGVGAEGERNRSSDTPINTKPISAELGGVSPTIVVPGEWSRADLKFQADNVVTSKMNNVGFNCIATQVLVLPESWDLKEAFLDEIRNILEGLEDRDAYYPGAADRCEAVVSGSGVVETFGSEAKRFLVTGLDPTNVYDTAFTTEYFAPALSVVALPSQDVPSYVAAATAFANETLSGTLGASIIVHPKTERAYPAAIDNMVESLRYGGIGVNTWSAAVYLTARCVWGAFPGHVPSDIGSGVGVVHNALMFSSAQKSVARAPFAPSHRTLSKGEFHIAPKPVFFLSNRQSHVTSRYLVDFTLSGKTKDLVKVVSSAIRG